MEKKRPGARFEEYGGCGKKLNSPTLKKTASQTRMYPIEHYHEEDVLAVILTQCVLYDNTFELYKYNTHVMPTCNTIALRPRSLYGYTITLKEYAIKNLI